MDLSAATLTIYYERLCRYSQGTLYAAFDVAIDSNEFFPSVAELKKIIRNLPGGGDGYWKATGRASAEEIERIRNTLAKFITAEAASGMERMEQRVADRRAVLNQQAAALGVKRDQ